MAEDIKQEMNGTPGCIPTKWTRTTVADGDWLQENTIKPLSSRDNFLADKLSTASVDLDALSAAIDTVSSISDTKDTFLSGSIDYVSATLDSFSAKVETSAKSLYDSISAERDARLRGDEDLQAKINVLEAANDVIMVYGTHEEFVAGSASLHLTDKDVIKVLFDDTVSSNQVYYEYTLSTNSWDKIGELDPYYSKSEIDDKETELSSTIASNYLSANGTDISAGKNLDVVIQSNNPRVAFKTKDDVSFSSVSAKGFSGTNLSGLNQNDTIDNLFGSAYSGAEASAWIYANSARLDIQAGYGLETGEDEGHLVIGLHQDHCDYYGHSLALGSYSTANGDNSYAFGMSCDTNGSNALAIGDNAYATTGAIALGTYNSAIGKYSLALGYNSSANNQFSVAIGVGLSGEAPITLGTWNDNVAGATFIIGDGTGTQAGHDVVRKNALVIKDGLVSGRDFSAGNVSLSSLTNISALGNGITNTATFNLSAVKLSAGQGIGFKNYNGVLSITAEGTTYNAGTYISTANKTISVTGDLIGSAESGKQAYDTVKNSATLSAGFGIQFTSAATTAMGIKLDATINADDKIAAIGGKELVGGNDVKIVGLISGTHIDPYEYSGNITSISAFRTAGVMEVETQGIVYSFKDNQGTNHSFYSIFVPSADSDSVQYLATSGGGGSRDYYWKDITLPSNYVQSSPANLTIVVGSTGTDLNTLYIY